MKKRGIQVLTVVIVVLCLLISSFNVTKGSAAAVEATFPPICKLPTITSITPDHGKPGETLDVVITGANLYGATEVYFGPWITVNNFNVASSTQITASITLDIYEATPKTAPANVEVFTPTGVATLNGGFIINPPKEGLCFIATAAYGTPMAPQIEVLRDFRDQCLLANPVGEALVDFYYKASPPIAEFIAEHPSLKPIVRTGLVPVVAMSTVAVNTTLAEKIAILGLLVLVSTALTVWVIWRRRRDLEYTRE